MSHTCKSDGGSEETKNFVFEGISNLKCLDLVAENDCAILSEKINVVSLSFHWIQNKPANQS